MWRLDQFTTTTGTMIQAETGVGVYPQVYQSMQIFDPSLTLVSIFAAGCLLLYGVRRYPRSVTATLVAFVMILCVAIIDIVVGAVIAT